MLTNILKLVMVACNYNSVRKAEAGGLQSVYCGLPPFEYRDNLCYRVRSYLNTREASRGRESCHLNSAWAT